MTVQELIALFGRYRHRTNDAEISQMCGLGASATVATNLSTANDIVFSLYNQQISYPAHGSIAVTACVVQAVSTFCYYLVSINLSSSVTVTKGTNNTYSLPTTPAGSSPVGAFLVTTDGVTTFTAGTTSLAAAGVTVAYFDIDCGISLQLINQAQRRLEQGVTIVRKGSQRTLMDFDYMLVRATATLAEGDTVVTLPFPNFKSFADEGIILTDSGGLITRLEKEDTLPIGTDISGRPTQISRRIVAETVFTTDGYPGMEFEVWPKADQAYTLEVMAYQYSPALDGVIYSRNWLTDNASDILLFGALAESGVYFGDDPQIQAWEARWQEAVWTMSASQDKAKYSGSHIGTKFPNPLGQSLYSEKAIWYGTV